MLPPHWYTCIVFMRLINVGCGTRILRHFINYDLPDLDICHRWPLPDSSVDYVLMSHVIEHVSRKDAPAAVAEAYRVLVPGGVLHIATPDMDKFIECHLSGDFSPLGGYEWTDLNYLLGGDPATEYRPEWRHRYMYSYGSLHYLLCEKFRKICRVNCRIWDSIEYNPISIYVDAVK